MQNDENKISSFCTKKMARVRAAPVGAARFSQNAPYRVFRSIQPIPRQAPDFPKSHTHSSPLFPPTPSPTSFTVTLLPTPYLLPQSPLSSLHSSSLAPKKFLCYNKRLPPTSPAPPAHTATLPRFRSLLRTPPLPSLSKCRILIHLQRQ